MIAIVDYNVGNLHNLKNALDFQGLPNAIVREPEPLAGFDHIILPGVGHFGQLVRSLDALGVRQTLKERIAAGVPFLGICLGLHLLFEKSEEAPELRGLGIYPGEVKRFAAEARVPQMGWNQLEPRGQPKLLAGLEEHPYVYFAHSYYVPAEAAGERAAAYSV